MPDLKRWLIAGFIAFATTGCGHDFGGDAVVGPAGELRLASETATTKPWASETTETNTVASAPIKTSDTATSPTSTAVSVPLSDGSASILAQTAASLAPGQSRKVPTSLTGSTLVYGSENADFIMWGSSGYYDPTRKEVGFIGKRDGPNQYHWLVYDEMANTWSNTRPVWDTKAYYGHGYDHNTIDPATGTVYFRVYGENKVRVWNGSWSETPAWSQNSSIVGGLSWFPGVGLMYNDSSLLLRYSGGAWSSISGIPARDSYHDFSEYNPTANALIFGSGNYGNDVYKITAALSVSQVASAPFNVGSSQSVVVSDPNSATLIAWLKETTNWAKYDIAANAWSTLTPCVGDGSAPASGVPNLQTGSSRPAIGIAIPQYGVIMFIQYRGAGSTPADVWLYRHS